jgi:hypothetical protein
VKEGHDRDVTTDGSRYFVGKSSKTRNTAVLLKIPRLENGAEMCRIRALSIPNSTCRQVPVFLTISQVLAVFLTILPMIG